MLVDTRLVREGDEGVAEPRPKGLDGAKRPDLRLSGLAAGGR